MAEQVRPSDRGELEITTLNQMYLEEEQLDVQFFGRGYTWFDTGTMDSLLDAAMFIRMIEEYQGIKVSVPEEIAHRNNWITEDQLLKLAERYGKSTYGQHLRDYLKRKFM